MLWRQTAYEGRVYDDRTRFAMTVVVDAAFIRCLSPQHFAAAAIQTKDLQRVLAIGPDAVRMDVIFAAQLVFDGFRAGDNSALQRSRQENTVAPDDGRRVAAPGNRRLPLHVLRGAPYRRQPGFRRNSLTVRAAPLRPVRDAFHGLCFQRLAHCGWKRLRRAEGASQQYSKDD